MNYQQQTLAVKNGIEMIVALYDGTVKFLHQAVSSIESGDVTGRRYNIKRALDIITYLQGRLQTDAGGESARALSEFYATMYSQCVIASRDGSVEILQETIRNIRTVRDAWQTVSSSEAAQNPGSNYRQMRTEQPGAPRAVPSPMPVAVAEEPVAHRWSA